MHCGCSSMDRAMNKEVIVIRFVLCFVFFFVRGQASNKKILSIRQAACSWNSNCVMVGLYNGMLVCCSMEVVQKQLSMVEWASPQRPNAIEPKIDLGNIESMALHDGVSPVRKEIQTYSSPCRSEPCPGGMAENKVPGIVYDTVTQFCVWKWFLYQTQDI